VVSKFDKLKPDSYNVVNQVMGTGVIILRDVYILLSPS